jgi:hypothetical protein
MIMQSPVMPPLQTAAENQAGFNPPSNTTHKPDPQHALHTTSSITEQQWLLLLLLLGPGTLAYAASSAAADSPCCSSAPPGSPRTHSCAR